MWKIEFPRVARFQSENVSSQEIARCPFSRPGRPLRGRGLFDACAANTSEEPLAQLVAPRLLELYRRPQNGGDAPRPVPRRPGSRFQSVPSCKAPSRPTTSPSTAVPPRPATRCGIGDGSASSCPSRRIRCRSPKIFRSTSCTRTNSWPSINKPFDMVVHPAKGHWSGTLVNALQFRFSQLSNANGDYRPGIVHRLDRDTSGVILVAKEEPTHRELSMQFEQRKIFKEYVAITAGRAGPRQRLHRAAHRPSHARPRQDGGAPTTRTTARRRAVSTR